MQRTGGRPRHHLLAKEEKLNRLEQVKKVYTLSPHSTHLTNSRDMSSQPVAATAGSTVIAGW